MRPEQSQSYHLDWSHGVVAGCGPSRGGGLQAAVGRANSSAQADSSAWRPKPRQSASTFFPIPRVTYAEGVIAGSPELAMRSELPWV